MSSTFRAAKLKDFTVCSNSWAVIVG